MQKVGSTSRGASRHFSTMSGVACRVPVGILVGQCMHERGLAETVQDIHGMSGVYCILGARSAPILEDHDFDIGIENGKTGTDPRSAEA